MNYSEDVIWYWFTNIPGVGRITRNRLLERFGSPVQLYHASEETINNIEFLHEKEKKNILSGRWDYVKQSYNRLTEKSIIFTHMNSISYPEKLRDIPDYPHSLYMRGKHAELAETIFSRPSVAVIGSRNCSKYGYETAYKLGYQLAANNIVVVSGMARGVDSAAQKGCVDAGGVSVAVLGCGVDICYPKENINLFTNIQNKGIIISEYPIGTPPRSGLFPERNRIISGLSDVIIVIEAGEKSGTFITVDMALEQGKEVYAVPGRITDERSRGCNNLIKQGAMMFSDIDEVIEFLTGMYGVKFLKANNTESDDNDSLEEDEKRIYSVIDMLPKHIEDIAKESQTDIKTAMRIIGNLEYHNLIIHTDNNHYVRSNVSL